MTLTLTKQEKRWGWGYLAAQMLVLPFAVAMVCTAMGITSEADMNLICFYLNAALALIVFQNLLVKSFRNCRIVIPAASNCTDIRNLRIIRIQCH